MFQDLEIQFNPFKNTTAEPDTINCKHIEKLLAKYDVFKEDY